MRVMSKQPPGLYLDLWAVSTYFLSCPAEKGSEKAAGWAVADGQGQLTITTTLTISVWLYWTDESVHGCYSRLYTSGPCICISAMLLLCSIDPYFKKVCCNVFCQSIVISPIKTSLKNWPWILLSSYNIFRNLSTKEPEKSGNPFFQSTRKQCRKLLCLKIAL